MNRNQRLMGISQEIKLIIAGYYTYPNQVWMNMGRMFNDFFTQLN
jgi:hypothetical protein